MGNVFEKLLENTEIELSEEDLKRPFSFRENGEVASLGELLDEKASAEVLESFGRTKGSNDSKILPISEVDTASLKFLVLEILNHTDSNERLVIVDVGSFTLGDLIKEVNADSHVGNRFVLMVLQHARFIEVAIDNGRVKPKTNETLELPPIEF